MEENMHSMSTLFTQLGEPDDAALITRFIGTHRPLAGDVRLPEAPFWNEAQAQFLREAIASDADWAVVVDELSASLRAV